MPEGPLGFPRLSDIGPLVDSIEPVIDLEPGVYSLERLEREQDKTAMDTKRFMEEILRADVSMIEEAEFRYDEYSIDEIVVDGGFIPTLSNFVGKPPEVAQDMSREELSSIAGAFPHHMSREEAVDKARNDIQRANEIHEDIQRSGEYWPPTFERNSSTLDGAHRTAALYHFTGMRNKIYAWELTNPGEVGVM